MFIQSWCVVLPKYLSNRSPWWRCLCLAKLLHTALIESPNALPLSNCFTRNVRDTDSFFRSILNSEEIWWKLATVMLNFINFDSLIFVFIWACHNDLSLTDGKVSRIQNNGHYYHCECRQCNTAPWWPTQSDLVV